jgi:hypothetical protein
MPWSSRGASMRAAMSPPANGRVGRATLRRLLSRYAGVQQAQRANNERVRELPTVASVALQRNSAPLVIALRRVQQAQRANNERVREVPAGEPGQAHDGAEWGPAVRAE